MRSPATCSRLPDQIWKRASIRLSPARRACVFVTGAADHARGDHSDRFSCRATASRHVPTEIGFILRPPHRPPEKGIFDERMTYHAVVLAQNLPTCRRSTLVAIAIGGWSAARRASSGEGAKQHQRADSAESKNSGSRSQGRIARDWPGKTPSRRILRGRFDRLRLVPGKVAGGGRLLPREALKWWAWFCERGFAARSR